NPEIQSGKQSDGQMTSESQKYPTHITGKSQIDDNKLLYCYICNVEQTWKEHKISYQHASQLHYFLNNFEESSAEYVKCKLCNNQISKSSFKKHAAKTHKLIPWYRPPTEPILYFINFIKPTKEAYKCLLCDKKLNNWYMALRHIELSNHRIRLKSIIKENVDEARLKIRFCREAIDHYIFSNGASRARCLACNIIFEEYNAVYEHFADETHKENFKANNIYPVLSLDNSMSLLLEDLKISDPKNSTSDDSAGTSNSESLASTSSGFGSTFRDPKLNDNNFDNEDNVSNKSPEKIEVVSPSNELKIYSEKLVIKEKADLALSNSKSIINWTKLENLILRFFENYIYIGDDYYYYCNLCRQSFSSLSSMSEHLDESDHKHQLLEEQKETCTNEYNAPYLPIFIESLISNNIFPYNLTKLKCFTCLTILPSYRSAEEHINSQLHRNNHIFLKAPKNNQQLLPESKTDVAIYCKNFIKKGRTDYYCHLCKSAFTSSIAVMTHIDTLEHCKLLSEETSKAFWETQYSLYFYELCVRNSIFRLSHKKLKCFACKGIEIRKNVFENHIKTPEHQTGIVSNNPSNDNQIPHNDNQISLNDDQISHNDNQIPPNNNQIPHNDNQIPQIAIKNSKSSTEKLIIKKDQLIPECDLENRFLKCFENYIFVSNSNYFCNLCEKEFSSLSSMFVHILDSTHINLLEERRKKHKISEHKFLHIPKLYEVLVRHNVFQFNPLTLICISCGCRLSGYISAEKHMNTKQHKITHKSRLDEIKSPTLIASEDECIDAATVLRKTKKKFAKYFKNSIEMRSEDYYCHLCCINVSSSEVIEHIQKPEHVKFVKNKFKDKYKVRKNIFYTELCVRNGIFCHTVPVLNCFTCNNLVGKKENIEKHVQSEAHKINRESRQQNTIKPQSKTNSTELVSVEPITDVKINKALPLQASNCLSNETKIEINQNIVPRVREKIDDTIQLIPVCDLENNYLIFYENFIFICGNTYRCNLCKKNFLSSSILSHINDSHHQNLLEEKRQESGISKHKVVYLPNFYELLIRNNIFQSDSLAIKCLSCECSITDYPTAEDHIDSEWHKNNIKFMAAIMGALIPIESKDKNSSGPQILPDTKEDFAKYFGNFIEKRQEDYYCHLCYITLSTWLEASAHMEVPKHRNIAKDQYVDPKIQSNLYYSELCVRNSIFCYSSTEFQCFSCKKNFFSMNDVELHVGIKRHKKKFKVNSIKKTSTETVPVSTQNSLNNNKNIAIYQSTGSTEGKKFNNQSISNLKLEDQFLTCFKHFICIFDKFYYCCLCENAFLSSVLMLLHINDPIHIYLLRKKKQGYAEHTVLYTPNFYELLVRNNVFLLNPLTVECLSCECRINGYISVEDHINGYTHKNTHKSIFEEINSPTLVSSEDKNADTIIGLPETKEDFDQYFVNFIEKRSEDYYCHLCCTKLLSSEVMVHIKIPMHLNLLKNNYKNKKAKNNFFYTELCVRNGIFSFDDPGLKCFICDKLVGEKKMIEEHVESEEHKTKHESIAISSSVTKTFSSELPTTQNQFLELFKNSIFLHEENCFCNLCEIYFPMSDAMTHIESRCHKEKVGYDKKKFLKVCIKVLNNFEELVRNNVFPINSSTLNCYSCNLKFARYQTIIYHLKTYEHKSGLNKLKTILIAEEKSASKESPKEQSKHKSVTNELKTTSVAEEKLKAKKSSKKQQKSKYNSSNILSCNIYKYNDTRNEFFYCCVCNLKIRSRNILHVHLSGHFWQLFTDEDMDNLMASAKLQSEKVLVVKNESVGQPVLNFLDGRRLAEIKEQAKMTGDKKPDKDVSLKKKKKRDKKKDDNKEKKDKKGPGRRFRNIKIEDLDVDENNSSNELDIYEMNEEIRNVIQVSLSRICIINKDEIYCMICRKNVEYSSRIVYEHFRSIEHSYFLTQMVQDHMKFESYPRELSDFELAREMMEDKSDRHVSCFVCNPAKPATIPNNVESLKFHINSERHQNKKEKLSENLQEFISNFYSRLERNWFNIQKYWCVICNGKFNLEYKFCRHFKSESHNKKLQNFIRFENLIFDFCPTCGILYYGFKNTFTYHSECQFHKFYRDKNSYFISQLPKLTEELVANAEEKLKNQLIKLESNEATRKNEEQLLLKDLKKTINNYGDAKIIDCDLSFTNGLTTENTKLVKLYVDKYPMCKKLILFMRYWIDACNLNGQDEIRSYAISWMVIYYLQTKFILPSVAELMKTQGESRVVGGWETKLTKDFKLPDIIDYSFRDLLYGFFIMCAGFDYRNNIICPLLGRPVKKIDFLVPKKMTNLPEEMRPYINFMKKNRKQIDGFRSDSVMGVQDPFDLSHNLTKAIKKFVVYRFRTYCAISADKLIN
ncbi:Similar to Tailor: Terminal uridylyltransferase Tailor (Drosophila melanogaster), partial [Cotesia congregata]